ncbi:MAG: HPr family phosphocarrier protein [Herbinix sp.]|jgi:phosphocarrier protein|nr:HPr family phosphocarrier protein [Herbinix sp.]
MKQFDYTITEEVGIHARPASLLVKEAGLYESNITLIRDGKSVDVKRLIALMALGVKYGEKVTFLIEGADEDIAAAQLEMFCTKNL